MKSFFRKTVVHVDELSLLQLFVREYFANRKEMSTPTMKYIAVSLYRRLSRTGKSQEMMMNLAAEDIDLFQEWSREVYIPKSNNGMTANGVKQYCIRLLNGLIK